MWMGGRDAKVSPPRMAGLHLIPIIVKAGDHSDRLLSFAVACATSCYEAGFVSLEGRLDGAEKKDEVMAGAGMLLVFNRLGVRQAGHIRRREGITLFFPYPTWIASIE